MSEGFRIVVDHWLSSPNPSHGAQENTVQHHFEGIVQIDDHVLVLAVSSLNFGTPLKGVIGFPFEGLGVDIRQV